MTSERPALPFQTYWLILSFTVYISAFLVDLIWIPDAAPEWRWANYAADLVKYAGFAGFIYATYPGPRTLTLLGVAGVLIAVLTLPYPFPTTP